MRYLHKPRKLLAMAAVLAATATGLSAGASASAASAPASNNIAVLQEFVTPQGGWFYTINPSEAKAAVSKYKFRKTANIGKIHPKPITGGNTVHRLRLKSKSSYMLSIAPKEWRNANFVDEGILGYVDGYKKAGEYRLVRWSNQNKWRVLADYAPNNTGMVKAGYSYDGPAGWYLP